MLRGPLPAGSQRHQEGPRGRLTGTLMEVKWLPRALRGSQQDTQRQRDRGRARQEAVWGGRKGEGLDGALHAQVNKR